jgi:signal transduction histidine kinase
MLDMGFSDDIEAIVGATPATRQMLMFSATMDRRIEQLAERRGIAYHTSISRDVPLIRADWEKLRHITENLVTNAVKYTRSGGSVTVDVDYLQPGTDSRFAQGAVRIRVRDTGIGIRKEDLDTIFDRYTQHDKRSNRRYKGSGLGLDVVRNLTAAHHGAIEVASEYKRGSTFTVLIPTDAEERYAASENQEAASSDE